MNVPMPKKVSLGPSRALRRRADAVFLQAHVVTSECSHKPCFPIAALPQQQIPTPIGGGSVGMAVAIPARIGKVDMMMLVVFHRG
jgi:hypothetical protein